MASVRLRDYRDDDLALTLAIETDADVMRHLGGARPEADVRRVHGTRVGLPHWYVVEDAATGAALGTIGAWATAHDGATLWEAGWTVLPAAQGRGVASAALGELLERLRADPAVDAVHAYPPESNTPSVRLCEKFGFTDAGVAAYDFGGHTLRCHDYRLRLDR